MAVGAEVVEEPRMTSALILGQPFFSGVQEAENFERPVFPLATVQDSK